MRDVAAEAGVSFKTVSRVVNGEGGVSPKLVTKVEAAVAQLGYRPDQRARLLRRSISAPTTIGFVLVDVANIFFSNLLRGIEEVAMSRQCLVLAGSTEGVVERERQLVETFVERRVAGLIVVSWGAAADTLRSEVMRGTPVVFVDAEPEIPDLDIDVVRSDHRAGAIAATRHLLAHGHTDVAYFGDDPAIFSARLRLAGFRWAMADAGLSVGSEREVTGSHSHQEWTDIIDRYLASTLLPTAIFTAQNFVTLGAVRALHHRGLRDVIAHVGFDDIDLADAVTPGVSLVPQDPRDLGRRAALQLFRRLDGELGPAVRQIIASEVIARGSGEIRATT
ncbi:MAG: LacI family transcriptional regulator [Acidimicrobiia bacterium]|nr:LacI family transcriptional regulator [Acidimicrobiia bacterium]